MPLTKATTNIINLNKDTDVNEVTIGKGGGNLSSNTALGRDSLRENITGANNTAVGVAALVFNESGSENTSVGVSSLRENITGSDNSAFGRDALRNNVGSSNTAIGARALRANTIGTTNTAVGNDALYSNTTASGNDAFGTNALQLNTTGFFNSAFGASSLGNTTNGDENVAVGHSAAISVTTGNGNTGIGFNSMASVTTQSNNTAIGRLSLTGSAYSNSSGIGYLTEVTGSNQVQLGNSATTTYAYGAVQNRSDIRDKADIRNTELGLEFVNALRPVDFKWDMREDYRPEVPVTVKKPVDLKDDATEEEKAKHAQDLAVYNAYLLEKDKWLEDVKLANITHDGSKTRNRFHHGLIAQEVKAVLDSKGIDFGGFQDHKISGGDDVLSIGYNELIAPMIKAIQELSAEVASLKAQLNS